MIYGFDIEIATPFPEDGSHWSSVGALGVSCASVVAEDGSGMLWYSAPGAPSMTQNAVKQMLSYITYLIKAGHQIITFNGAGFDWRMLGYEIGDFSLVSKLARVSYDPCYAMLKMRGFPVGLAATCAGMGLEGKLADMDGKTAVDKWSDYLMRPKIMEYNIQDSRVTMQLGQILRERGVLRWVTQADRIAEQDLPFLPTSHYMTLPMPDQSWMRPKPGFERPPQEEDFVGWIS